MKSVILSFGMVFSLCPGDSFAAQMNSNPNTASTGTVKYAIPFREVFQENHLLQNIHILGKRYLLNTVSPEELHKFKKQTSEYARWKRLPSTNSDKIALVEKCDNPWITTTPTFFCPAILLEKEDILQKRKSLSQLANSSAQGTKYKSKQDSISKIIKSSEIEALLKKDWPVDSYTNAGSDKLDSTWLRLQEFSIKEYAQALKNINNAEAIKPTVQKVLWTETKTSPYLSIALAQKLEEFFPDKKNVTLALQLYKKGIQEAQSDKSTADDLFSRAHFRIAMLQIWQNDCKKALPHLDELLNPMTSAFGPRAHYWKMHCLNEIEGKTTKESQSLSQNLRASRPLSYHSLLVNLYHKAPLTSLISNDKEPDLYLRSLVLKPDTNKDPAALKNSLGAFYIKFKFIDELLTMIELLHDANEIELAKYLNRKATKEVLALLPSVQNEWKDPLLGVALYLGALKLEERDNMGSASLFSELLRQYPTLARPSVLRAFFNTPYLDLIAKTSKEIDPFLVLSLVRQESAFDHKARSIANARGLMQLLPSTANKFKRGSARNLYDPVTNVTVGTRYLKWLVDRFSGQIELALASYNAGELKVDDWQKRYPTTQLSLFLELIPFSETREYVSTIMRNYVWYQLLYSPQLSAQLDNDSKKFFDNILTRNPAQEKTSATRSAHSQFTPVALAGNKKPGFQFLLSELLYSVE